MHEYNFAPNYFKGPPIEYFLKMDFGTSKMSKKWICEVCSCSSKLGLGRFWESCVYVGDKTIYQVCQELVYCFVIHKQLVFETLKGQGLMLGKSKNSRKNF